MIEKVTEVTVNVCLVNGLHFQTNAFGQERADVTTSGIIDALEHPADNLTFDFPARGGWRTIVTQYVTHTWQSTRTYNREVPDNGDQS